MRVEVLRAALPFARGYGMEIGMTSTPSAPATACASTSSTSSHRATGRTLAGFAHRARQLADFARVYLLAAGAELT